jgi:hypothetical protein
MCVSCTFLVWPHALFVQRYEGMLNLLPTLNIPLYLEYVQFQSIRSNGFVVERTFHKWLRYVYIFLFDSFSAN